MMQRPALRFLLAGVALIAVTNAVALLGVAYNRAGTPESVLKLSQRELGLPYSWADESENSGLALNLRWRVLAEETGQPEWLDHTGSGGTPAWLNKSKLAALGFDVSKAEGAPESGRHYGKQLSREVLLILELSGPAYQQVLQRARQRVAREEALQAANPGRKEFEQRAKSAREQLGREELENSRLFVIDAGLDAGNLRARYPDRTRYAIVRGQVRPHLFSDEKNPQLRVVVTSLSNKVNVPLALHQAFGQPRPPRQRFEQSRLTRYEVTLAFGQRFEPWMLAARAQ